MKLTLKYPHTHAGIRYEAGAVIDVSGPAAEWLLVHDRAEAPKLKAVPNAKAPSKAQDETKTPKGREE